MYQSEEYDGWNIQITTVNQGGIITAIAIINRENLEFRFENFADADTERASAARAGVWLRGWLDLNQLTGVTAVGASSRIDQQPAKNQRRLIDERY
ncbi:hypothetical protein AWB74_06205 [Caballeronia arvi]|uniref:Uncharacterized protein n=1 Tax=Caballeronia arvi TaxID=1777135 RepID=A0A158KNT9_9BURK|nr:hypothetical protein [Caballeronia arvi]SAL82260.1 hypothetical protein AWB74_06205 [Caballeronia arvi]